MQDEVDSALPGNIQTARDPLAIVPENDTRGAAFAAPANHAANGMGIAMVSHPRPSISAPIRATFRQTSLPLVVTDHASTMHQ
ncbi:hypothetical protein [Burkholderia lata]|uniref:hypothetical protein n=1 Tax=Burkholderia lata (strain ATCC 17760 / DSM 23089 / LMG 22485 / NCIMB 9086 / R18194 / 383) TaxID=482957 RepID=UPI001583A8F7|nr:hypothetical protein [Burkholderia lata]